MHMMTNSEFSTASAIAFIAKYQSKSIVDQKLLVADFLTWPVHVVEIDPHFETFVEQEFMDFVGELFIGMAVGDHDIVLKNAFTGIVLSSCSPGCHRFSFTALVDDFFGDCFRCWARFLRFVCLLLGNFLKTFWF